MSGRGTSHNYNNSSNSKKSNGFQGLGQQIRYGGCSFQGEGPEDLNSLGFRVLSCCFHECTSGLPAVTSNQKERGVLALRVRGGRRLRSRRIMK